MCIAGGMLLHIHDAHAIVALQLVFSPVQRERLAVCIGRALQQLFIIWNQLCTALVRIRKGASRLQHIPEPVVGYTPALLAAGHAFAL
jgi:hypothetical protein